MGDVLINKHPASPPLGARAADLVLAEARHAKGLKDRGTNRANRFDTNSASTRAFWAMQWARKEAGRRAGRTAHDTLP